MYYIEQEARSVSITGLTEMTTYVVHVQALSKYRPGLNGSIQFTTPRLHLQPVSFTPSTKFEITTSAVDVTSTTVLSMLLTYRSTV
jgi:hypothetical protein